MESRAQAQPQPFGSVLRAKILQPLSMTMTAVGLDDAMRTHLARGAINRPRTGTSTCSRAVEESTALRRTYCAIAPLHFFIFDLLVLKGKDLTAEPLQHRRELIEKFVLPKLTDQIRYSPVLEGSLKDLIHYVKAQGLEGLVAKRRNSKYEPGLRSGAWPKMRVNRGQELVIAGYTPPAKNFDALVIGYYDEGKLIYAARTRNGFTPASRIELFKKTQAVGN